MKKVKADKYESTIIGADDIVCVTEDRLIPGFPDDDEETPLTSKDLDIKK